MQTRRGALVAALCSLSFGSLGAKAQQAPPTARAVGVWAGSLNVGAYSMRLQMTIRRDSAGALAGVMKSVDQGGVEAPATVEARGDTVSFAIPDQKVRYFGVMNPAGDSITGMFSQGQSLPLTLVRSVAAAPARRPQDPEAPFPYETREVAFESAPGVRLAGTIDIPKGNGPFPTVVFVTGSGPQDRDEAGMGHRPFLVIADYLARHGIASLRYDDRGTAQSTGTFASSTTADFAVDAEAALRFLRGMPQLASTVGILGHSEGGLIGPMIAARSRDVGFLVLLAGPGVSDDSLSLLQIRALASATGTTTDRLDESLRVSRLMFDAVRGARDSADAVARIAAAKGDALSLIPAERRQAVSLQMDQSTPRLINPWMRYFLKYDTRSALRQVHVPVLALGGSLDIQVPAKEDLAGISASLKTAGNHDYSVMELPGLNHLFQTAKTGLPTEYASIDETIAPHVLELIGSWINQRFGARPPSIRGRSRSAKPWTSKAKVP
jgi:alpha/beta superfamily hydrolase